MKHILTAVITASLAILPTGLSAEKPDIVVSSGRSIDNFVEDVATDINRELNRKSYRMRAIQGTGVAQVLFESSPYGEPINLKMYRHARDEGVNRLARRAVSRIRSLHPLPQGVDQDQLYLANIIIANDAREYDQLSRDLNQREAQRIASAKGDRKVFAFNLSASPYSRN